VFAPLKRLLVGRPIPTFQAHHQKLGMLAGLAILSSDALSSVSYATEEVLRVLARGGPEALDYGPYIAGLIALLLLIIVSSYRQTIFAYPQGGGDYIVTKENIGTNASLVTAAALLIDYTLTVAVSIAAGVSAITSALPDLHVSRVPWPWSSSRCWRLAIFAACANQRSCLVCRCTFFSAACSP